MMKENAEASETGVDQASEEETLGINYGDLIPVLIQAIKEQQNTIELLERRIEKLEGQ